MTTATLKPQTKTPARKKLKCASPATTATTPTVADAAPRNTQLKLSKGSKVEVKIDEEGFRGAWYGATVVEMSPSSKRKRKKNKAEDLKVPARYLVEYDTLLAREGNSSEPLREFADVSSIRPAPPEDGEGKRVFQLYDVVDAFHRDGWWTGVVTRVGGKKGGSKFTVYFQNPPEEREFNRSDLRLHGDWDDGKWSFWQPRETIQKMAGSMFSIGTEVEVSLDKGKVGDVWYLAVLIGEIGNKAFLVECYKTDSNNEASQRRVTVDALHIRPCPPSLEYRDFTLFGKADVFCGFGWARGLITRVLEDDRYIVLLDHTNEEKELSLGDMRPCMDWIDGKWVTKVGKQQKVIIVENKEQSLVETKTMSPKSGVEIPDASVPGKAASASINASKEDGQLQCMSIVIGLKCKKTRDVHTPHRKEKQSVKLLGREKKPPNAAELLQNSTQEIAEPESEVSSQKRKRGRPPKSMTKGHTVTEENGAETISSEVLMKDNPEIEAVRLSETGIISQGRKKHKKRLGGRPKSMTKRHTVTEENGAETVSSEVLMKDNPEIEAVRLSETGIISQGRKKHKKRLGGPRRRTNKLSNIVSPLERINKQSNLTVASKSSSVLKTYSSKRQIQRSISDTEPLIPDTEDAFGEKTSRVNEAVVNETLSQNSDDLPLLTWFGGKKSRSTVHDSGISLDNTIKQCTNINGRCEETATKSPATASEDVIESEKDEKLPFAKCFPVWPTLESMEVFRQIPQKPHFKPLLEVKESNREGLAIAHMVTFANIAEASSKLQIDDLKITIESNLETLSDLESHGFKVGPIRDRLNQFLLKKDEKGKLVDRLQVVRADLEERSHESSKIDEEVQELDRKIEELQAKLDSAKSGGGKIDAIIAAMEIENDVINRDVQSARHDFEMLAATPW